MMRDEPRVRAYTNALREAVTSDSIVLDLGAGPGLFSLMACAFGAKKVYAIEFDPCVRHLRELAKENGYADRIVVFEGNSKKITLPERANVLVTDIRGALPLFGDNIAILADARARHLTPNARFVPQDDVVRAAVVRTPAIYDSITGPFPFGRTPSLNALTATARNAVHVVRGDEISADQIVSTDDELFRVKYAESISEVASGSVKLTVLRDGMAHGLCVYFDSHTSKNEMYTSRPGNRTVHGNAFFPWEREVDLRSGDVVSVDIWANPRKDSYLWGWNSRVERSGVTIAEFRQSTFLSEPMDNPTKSA